MQSVKAVVFDVDGVLVDSRDFNVALLQKLLQKTGYKRPTRSAVLACFHLPLWQTLEKLTGSNDQNEIRRIWEIAHDQSLHPTHLFKFPEHLKETLQDLHDKYRLGVVTSRIKVGLEKIFAATDIGQLFDAVVTFEDYKKPKPHPEPLLVAANLLNVNPAEAIYVGDSPVDVEAARAAGMKSIRISSDHDQSADQSVVSIIDVPAAVARLG